MNREQKEYEKQLAEGKILETSKQRLAVILDCAEKEHWYLLNHNPETEDLCESWFWLTPEGVLIEVSHDSVSGFLEFDNRIGETRVDSGK